MSWHGEIERNLAWLVIHSLQAGVLVLLVLAVQWLLRRHLASRWRFALWWIVLARLLLPLSPQCALSLFNVFQPAVRLEVAPLVAAVPVKSPPAAPLPPIQNPPAIQNLQLASPDPQMSQAAGLPAITSSTPAVPQPNRRIHFENLLPPALAALWLAGVLILSVVVAVQLIRFRRRLATARPPANPQWQRLLDDCRCEFNVSRPIELLETDAVRSPALFGLLRLQLLLPRGLGEQFAGRELRFIFLHEIAHVKRGDLWLNWLVTALQILHWFNPLLWFGFARLRADRELACDELALLRAGESAGAAYGETVVKLLEKLSRPAAIPGLVGILEDKKEMRRRISMIANFRRPGRWSVLAIFLVIALAAVALTDAQSNPVHQPAGDASPHTDSAASSRPDLSGVVTAKDGQALPVPATVFIATAAPKIGTSTFCPSCYADCVKHAQTDARGNFKIESLDPQLKFRILAVAKGYRPKYVSNVDPVTGKPLKIELEPAISADATPDRCLRGQVVDEHGRPVEGAVVEMSGIHRSNGEGMWGSISGVDPLAVTDAKGEFLLTAKDPFAAMDVKVSARMFADKSFANLPAGQENKLVITEGASLIGRVLSGGKPLAGVSVGLSGVNRAVQDYLGHYEIGTDAQGRFAFVNLPPNGDFHLYTLMHTMKGAGAAPIQTIRTGRDGAITDARDVMVVPGGFIIPSSANSGATTNVGDLIVMPAFRLAGRVELADGLPVPAGTRLLVSRSEAWDSLQVNLRPDGAFDVMDIPDEIISLSVRVHGYRLSSRNLSLDAMNPFQLLGRVDHDITNLVILLESGPELRPDYSQVAPDYMDSRNHTLRGAEGKPDHSHDWILSGSVVDADTKAPLQNFSVTPGQKDNFGRIGWNILQTVKGSNGTYQTYLNMRYAEPMLKVSADGYLPEAVSPPSGNATNVNFALKRGSGPTGTVLAPDGTPVTDASVVLLNGDPNRAVLKPRGSLSVSFDQSGGAHTDTNGHFQFKPEWGIVSVAVGAPQGFAMVPVQTLATNPIIRLQAFGEIEGTLQRKSGPGTNEALDLSFTDVQPGFSPLNLNLSTVTDARGRFKFEGVPAGHFQISCRQAMNGRNLSEGWQNIPLKTVDVQPRQTSQVNIVTGDRQPPSNDEMFQPPPPKMVSGEQLKGVVLLPNGQPATDADVALQIEGKYLGLGRGAFTGGPRDETATTTAPDGSFTLPMFEKTESIIALNQDGYAQVSLKQLKASPQIRLQKWGRIEGTLQMGHHLGTNQTLVLSGLRPRGTLKAIRTFVGTNETVIITNTPNHPLQAPHYDYNAFRARTDDQGRFTFTYVPPGPQTLSLQVPLGHNSWSQNPLADLEVKPGDNLVTNVGEMGRAVVGKIILDQEMSNALSTSYSVIRTPTDKYFQKLRDLKTDAERLAYYDSMAKTGAFSLPRTCVVHVSPDGSFRGENVSPGAYEIQLHPRFDPNSHQLIVYTSGELTLPPAGNNSDDDDVDWGTIILKKEVIPIPSRVGH